MYIIIMPPDQQDVEYGFIAGNTYGPFSSLEAAETWAQDHGVFDIIQISLLQDKSEMDWKSE